MNKKWCSTILAMLLFFSLPIQKIQAQSSPDRVAYTLFDDFETGELYGWEPYPYSQDLGFDALYFARSSPTYQHSKYSLARPVKAADATELYQGFTKRLNIYTKSDTRIKMALYFQGDRNPTSLELSLGTFDGRRYFYSVSNPEANQWVEIDVPASAFKSKETSLGIGEHLQVITVKATYNMVYYLYTYTILMDNVQINGERQRQFIAQKPSSTNFEQFDKSILNQHFFYGDNLFLSIVPEEKIPLKKVEGKLLDGHNRIIKDHITFVQKDNTWTNASIYHFTKNDLPGQWEIQLAGISPTGSKVEWSFHFLMPGKHITTHPRLFFTESELQKRIANEKSPVARSILDKALKDTGFLNVDVNSINEGEDMTGNNLVGGPYSKTAVGFNAMGLWLNPLSRLGNIIRDGSFRYAFIHDAASGAQAKKALLKLCSFSKWNNNWMLERKFWTYYPVGYTIKPIAYGYDMLYDLLSEDERKYVRDAIINKGLKLFYRDMVEMNRMPSNMTNHIAVIVTGFGLAATAIYGDDPSNPYLEPFLSGIITKAKTFIDRTYYADGSYGEPKSGYMDMATRDIIELMSTLERNFGLDYSITTNVGSFYKYPLQASFSNGLIQAYGDGDRHYRGFTQEHAEWFVKRTGNPYLYGLIKPYWEAGKGGYLGYLWYRDDIKAASKEELPESKVFSAQGMVMRSGWSDSSTIITTRVGPNSNHYHYDQGSFQVMTNKYELLTDPGIGHLGYYANLDYLIYNIQAIGHNVLLVDHDPESQNPAHYDNKIEALKEWPVMIHSFAGNLADACTSELSSVYKSKLQTYLRTLLYTKTGPLFLWDHIVSSDSKGHVYDWLFHAPLNEHNQRSIKYSNQRVLIDRPGARLTMDILSPSIPSSVIRDRDDKEMPENYIVLTSKPALKEVDFFAVLFPEAKDATQPNNILPKTTEFQVPGWLGARVDQNAMTYYGFFRTTFKGTATLEGFTTDASELTASLDHDQRLKSVYFQGSQFEYQGQVLHSSLPVTLAASFDRNIKALEVQTSKPVELTISLTEVPAKILVNGTALKSWKYDTSLKQLSIEIKEGNQSILIQ